MTQHEEVLSLQESNEPASAHRRNIDSFIEENKKTDVEEYLLVLHHVGLLVNEPLSTAELPFN
jgi:hypothetical protein